MSDLGRSAGVMAAGTATSRVLGVVRVSVLAAAIGANAAGANAFALANWLPNMLYMLVAGGVLNAVLVPQVVRAYRSPGGQAFVDRLLTLSGVLLLALTAFLTLAAPVVVRVAANDRDPEFIGLATTFALWCIPQVLFYGLYTLLGQVLNARGSFGPYMWAPVVNNVVAIVGLLVFMGVFGAYVRGGPQDDPSAWDAGRVALLGGGATLGVVAQALVLVVPLHRSGFRFRPRRDWRGAGLGTAGRVAGWTFAALVVGQLGIIAVMQVSTAAAQEFQADVAGNNAYTLAFTIFMLPHSLVTVSLLTALFTRLSQHAAADDVPAVREDFSSGLRIIGAFTVIATAVLAVCALPLVRVVLPSIEPAEAGSIAPVVVALLAGLAALGAWSLCQRIFYAYEDAKGLFWIQVAMAGVVAGGSVLGAVLLPPRWWVVTAGASIAASYVVGAVWGGVQVRRRLGGSGRGAVVMHVKAVASAVVATAVGWPVLGLFGDLSAAGFVKAALACVGVGALMLAVYVGGLRLLGVDDVTRLAEPLLARLGRSMGARVGLGARGAGRTSSARGGDRVDVVVEQGTLLAGRYRLERPLASDLPRAEGWEARDQILDRPVRALVLRGDDDAGDAVVRRAQDAARRAALVTDPRLLRVLDVGDHEGLAYTVTEPLPGRSLAELTADGPLPADQARAIVGEAAVALEVARRRGVHHLALRPAAVRVTPTGGVVVSGLGLDGELLGLGIGDARTTTRADTVGLVALLHLALTGHWPARDGVPAEGVEVAPVVDGAPVPPADLVEGLPGDLDTLCAVTLGPNDDGPHSPAELVRELEPWGAVDGAVVGAGAGAGAGAGVAAGGAEPTDDAADDEATTANVQRQSVRAALAAQSSTKRPGTTPPPAIPPAIRRADPRAGQQAGAAAG
ncbi:murein biosynthesis integral membrane protein MurJ, partial [Actinotalea ferrariae]|uniref:murein biosynthesis integral membrane protein MurJ n=1 Tax=Actinotalea ferrariae TaxID=1386098 RepID=UPI0027DF3611